MSLSFKRHELNTARVSAQADSWLQRIGGAGKFTVCSGAIWLCQNASRPRGVMATRVQMMILAVRNGFVLNPA
jgi:hypothetical protein